MTREEAINEIKKAIPTMWKETKEALGILIPEFAESEDERIRKELWEYFHELELSSDRDFSPSFTIDDILAWLEKQKEEEGCEAIPVESTLEYKLGFKAGKESEKQEESIPYIDFVIKPHKGDDNNPYDMQVSEAQEYAINRGFGIPFNDGEVYVDERHMTQTIGNILRWADEHPKEQKPADKCPEYCVMSNCMGCPIYEKQKEQKSILKFKVGDKIHLIDGTSPNYEDDCITIGEIGTVNYFGEFKEGYVPIKEQDKWELVKEQKSFPKFKVGDIIRCKWSDREFTIKSVDLTNMVYNYTKEGYGNDIDYADENFELVGPSPADWSKNEDVRKWILGKMRELVATSIPCSDEIKMIDRAIDYLIKQEEQKLAEWDEDDERNKDRAIFYVCDYQKNNGATDGSKECVAWLKSLQQRFNPQPKQEWSEEDEKLLNKVEVLLDDYCDFLEDESSRFIPEVRETISRLKSLRPSWKPSEE